MGDDKERHRGSPLWDEVIWNKGVGAGQQLAAGVVPHDGVGLDVQVTGNFIQMPMTNEADDIRIDLG